MVENIPNHIAIIMDGNRRWAKKRGLPTQLGHSQGAKTLEKIAVACEEKGIKHLTVYAFSTENWKRSKEEVDYLMELLANNIKDFDKRFKNRNVRIKLVGDINGLPKKLQEGIKKIKAIQQRISEVQAQAQQMQLRASQYLGTQGDIVGIGQIGNNLINQAMTI